MYKGIIFDLDGTLLDTTEGVVEAVEITLSQLGLEKPKGIELKQFVGPPMQDSFQKYYCMKFDDAMKAANIFRNYYKEFSLFKAGLYNGVFELLELLKKNNYRLAVATNKSHENAVAILEKYGISQYCDFIKGSDIEGKLKKTDIINICINKLDIMSRELLYIGDSIYDLQGAQNSKLDFLGVTYGFGFGKSDVIDVNQCVAVCNSVWEIIDFLNLNSEE